MNGSRHQLSDTLPFMFMATNRTWKKQRAAGAWYFRLIDLNMMAGWYPVRRRRRSTSQSNNSPESGGRLSWSLLSTTNGSKRKASWFPSVCLSGPSSLRYPWPLAGAHYPPGRYCHISISNKTRSKHEPQPCESSSNCPFNNSILMTLSSHRRRR